MFQKIKKEFLTSIFIELSLFFLLLFSPFIYGSITILPLSLIEAVSFFLLFVFLFTLLLKKELTLVRLPASGLFLFLSLVIFQMILLPRGILSLLSPYTTSLYKDFSAYPAQGLSLSIYPEAGINILLQFLSCLAIFWVVLNYINSEGKIRRLVLLIISCGFLYSLYGITRKIYISGVEFSTFTSRNHFAAYMEMVIPLTVVYAFLSDPPAKRLLFIFIAAVEILALFLCASRAGIACFFLSLFLLLFLLRLKKSLNSKTGILIILFLLLIFFLGIVGLAPLTERVRTFLSPGRLFSGRIEVFLDSLGIIGDFPLFGTGLGTFAEIFPKYNTLQTEVFFRFGHNEPLQLIVETGILGFLCIFLFLYKYFQSIFSLWLKRNYPFAVYITLGSFIGIFSIALHSVFDFVFHIPANTLLFFVILAIAYRSVYTKGPHNLLPIPERKITLPLSLRVFLAGVIFLSLIFAESLVLRRYQAQTIFEKLKEKISATGTEAIYEYHKLLRQMDKAISLNPFNSQYVLKKADLLSELALVNLADQGALLEQAEGFYQKAIQLNPAEADYHIKLGWLYDVSGRAYLRQEEFKKALLLDPKNIKMRAYTQQYLK